jgi:hypothetical protein
VRLLATVLAEQRGKPSQDPIELARQHFGRLSLNDGALSAGVIDMIKRALRVVRIDLASLDEKHPEAAQDNDERTQCRIKLSSPVNLSLKDRGKSVEAALKDIAWGGAAIVCAESFASVDDSVWLMLPVGRGIAIPILATVLRATITGDQIEFGLRFDSIKPDDALRFRRTLEILLKSGEQSGHRQGPRLVQRLDIESIDTGDLRSTLEDISTGGLLLTLLDRLELHASILIVLSSVDGSVTLELRARVVHRTLVREGGMEMYRTGLQFEHPEPELKASVASMLEQVVLRFPDVPLDNDAERA